MFVKKIYNDLDTLVDEAIQGNRLLASPDSEKYSALLPNSHITVRSQKYRKPKGLVKLSMMGGAGHEGPPGIMCRPGGFDVMTQGDVFVAPSARQIFRALSEIDDGSPIIMSVTNHAGDILNAKLCLQMARAKGMDVYMHISYDDLASAKKGHEKERRAIGGSLSVMAIMAECGECVEEILRVSENCNILNRSYGVGIRSAIHPVTGLPIMAMPDDQIELGIGIHGESSGNRVPLMKSRELAKTVCDTILEDMPIEKGEDIVLSLSGLGGLTWMEIDILYKDLYEYLTIEKGLKIWRHSARNSGTQELGGFIVSIGHPDDEIKKWMQTPLPDIYPKN